MPTTTDSSGGDQPGEQPEHDRRARPDEQLREDVLPVAVVPSRWVAFGASGSAWPGVVADGSYGAIARTDDRDQDEEAEDHGSDLRLAVAR